MMEYRIQRYPGSSGTCPVIYLNSVTDDGGEIKELCHNDFTLISISGLDWNADLTPWPSPAVFRNGEPFAGRADDYMRTLAERIVPEAEDGLAPAWRGIAGYSLAGLFAIYALYRTDLFSRAASISGSLWYPGFRDFSISSQLKAKPDRLYLSLGDRESKGSTSTVLGNTEAIAAHFSSIGISTLFELNPGNHFTDPVGRTAKGIDFITGWISSPGSPDQRDIR